MQPSACTCQCCASFVFDCVSLKEPRPTLDVPASEVCFPFACTCQCCASLPFACVSLKEPRYITPLQALPQGTPAFDCPCWTR
ncbi:BZ3500_MvSof-1268-A1-R1_Chr1-3g01984 [Microbotryum saponariae]|uniref:BZ3500_MvSof-1268-A1-R1_Chr1-3g01984 protein n=2 Tax=Microbotryum saponariae TaxID=289078 RepID=A0A2X0KQD6_9BASI|nr:BZ3500_MvSof-1268-A1-R1_Chr1-3g01984 [Microbotryum saponariae]SCZ95097.1 BZ3501_MvSof-1269-A2-R1_Chr1-3g01586 [Microbotryum saponariae]